MKKLILGLLALMLILGLNGCEDSKGSDTKIKTIEDIFISIPIGINESQIPKIFAKTDNKTYSGYLEGFKLSINLDNHIVKKIEAKMVILPMDHTHFDKLNKIKQILFYSDIKELEGKITTNYEEGIHTYKIETNTWGQEYCYYTGGFSIVISKKLKNNSKISIHYNEGTDAPVCDDIRSAREIVTVDSVPGSFIIRKYANGYD